MATDKSAFIKSKVYSNRFMVNRFNQPAQYFKCIYVDEEIVVFKTIYNNQTMVHTEFLSRLDPDTYRRSDIGRPAGQNFRMARKTNGKSSTVGN